MSQFKIAKNMEKILFSLNANFVVVQPNGSAGEILIFVILAIKDNVPEIMSQNTRRINYQNVEGLENVLSEEIMMEMENKRCWDVQFAEIINKITKAFDKIVDFILI